jgi:hypothetical protein
MDFPKASDVATLLQLVTPGIIITAIRSRAVSGLAPELKDKILEFGVISVIYGSTVGPFFIMGGGQALSATAWQLLYSVAVPIAVGVILAYVSGYGLIYKAAQWIKLPIAHHLPTAWDYTFESLPAGTFILVTLKNGTTIPGKMAKDSFASSNEEERDLLIEELWQIDQGGQWSPASPPRSALICGNEIRLVEVF